MNNLFAGGAPRLRAQIFAALFLLGIGYVCHAKQTRFSPQKYLNRDSVTLGLIGYNYSNRHISEYSVNGSSGGHVNLSTPTSGGSGVTCCVKFSKSTAAPILVKIRWQLDGCKALQRNPQTGATAEMRYFYYKEAEFEIPPVEIGNPKFFETHFYPDGTVQVQVTANISEPRIISDAKRPDESSFLRCKNGENADE